MLPKELPNNLTLRILELGNIRKVPKLHRMIASPLSPCTQSSCQNKNCINTRIKLFKNKLNSCRSVLFHMNPRVSLKYSLNNCSLLNMLVSIIKYHCLSHSKCGVCCINVFLYSLDIFCFVELCLCTLYLNGTVERFF